MIDFETLYGWVKDLPIIDWHNHLDMKMLAEDRPLGSLYEVWVRSDPYKHRAMRICGEPERVITGDAPEAEKWAAWMRTLPKLVGNPLFAWAKMEMEWLGAFNAEAQRRREAESVGEIWWRKIENVPLGDLTPSKMLKRFCVEYLSPCVGVDFDFATKDTKSTKYKVVPSLRMNAGDEVSVEVLERFHAAGCRVVDVSVDDVACLRRVCGTRAPAVAAFAAAHGWTMLLHMGAMRETSARLRAAAGAAGGFAGMHAPVDPAAVAEFLNGLETAGALPRTILLTLNPEAHAQLAVLAGAFNGEGMPGKLQLGPAWWWCDHEEGIRDVLEKTAAYGVLSTFVGMTTDSRSLLSFVRHDYFRRILCGWTAEKVASGAFPDDESILRPMLENVCCGNARKIVSPEMV